MRFCVLTPPGEDPAAALRAGGLVLPEDTDEETGGSPRGARRLGVGVTLRFSTEPGSGDPGSRSSILRLSISLRVIVCGLTVSC